MKGLGSRIAGMCAGLAMTGAFLYLIANVDKIGEPEVVMAAPPLPQVVTSRTLEEKISNRGLPEDWPGSSFVIASSGLNKGPEETLGLQIWDATDNYQRKVFRIRSAYNRGSNEPNVGIPIATVFMEPGERVDLPIPVGRYEVYAISGMGWHKGFETGNDVVSFGEIQVKSRNQAFIVIGGVDQPVTTIPRSWF